MLVIRRTDSGGLRLSDGRRTDTAGTEEQARRLVTSWGYGNFSFNRALILMKEEEGSIAPVANPWTARSRGATASPPVGSASEAATPVRSEEPTPMKASTRAPRRPARADTPSEPTASSTPVVRSDATVAETAVRPRRARKAPGADVEPAPPAVEAVPESAAEAPTAGAAEKPAKGSRSGRVRKAPSGVAPADESPEVRAASVGEGAGESEATESKPAPRPKRTGRGGAKKAEPVAAAAGEGTGAPEPETQPARSRSRARKAAEPTPAGDSPPSPVPAAEAPAHGEVPEPEAPTAPRPKRPRAPRRRTAAEAPAAPTTQPVGSTAGAARGAGARTPDEWLEAARALFAEGTQALREIEKATLPFARDPWTELRTRSAEILACLQGERPPRG